METKLTPEELFKNIISDVVKPFILVIGNNAIQLMQDFSNEFMKNNPGIIKIDKRGPELDFKFKSIVKDKDKIKILSNFIVSLRKLYINEIGSVTNKMIDFVVNDYNTKYNLKL